MSVGTARTAARCSRRAGGRPSWCSAHPQVASNLRVKAVQDSNITASQPDMVPDMCVNLLAQSHCCCCLCVLLYLWRGQHSLCPSNRALLQAVKSRFLLPQARVHQQHSCRLHQLSSHHSGHYCWLASPGFTCPAVHAAALYPAQRYDCQRS
jgi:hypothetical protein